MILNDLICEANGPRTTCLCRNDAVWSATFDNQNQVQECAPSSCSCLNGEDVDVRSYLRKFGIARKAKAGKGSNAVDEVINMIQDDVEN